MITVVVSTLLLCDKEIFIYSLAQYCACDIVEKVIIIDNSQEQNAEMLYYSNKIVVLKNGIVLSLIYMLVIILVLQLIKFIKICNIS